MSVAANCGHEVEIGETVLVREGHESCDAVDGYRAAVNNYSYCPVCAERAKTWDTYLADDAAVEWWFTEGYRQWRERIMRETANPSPPPSASHAEPQT